MNATQSLLALHLACERAHTSSGVVTHACAGKSVRHRRKVYYQNTCLRRLWQVGSVHIVACLIVERVPCSTIRELTWQSSMLPAVD